ncbi:MAG TPA: M56 family metallopeptidase, partial [Polyangia bacterium]
MLGSGAESILHGLISGAAVTLLLRLRPRESPGLRLALLTVGIAWPALLTPLLRGFCPGRLAPPFRDGPALLSGSHFAMLQPAGGWVLATLAGLGTLLFLRDLIPFLWDAFRWRRLAEKAVQGPEWQAARAAAQRLGVKAPMVVVVESGQPILLCRGPLRPRIVASANLRQRLAPDELEAAVIHEVSHAARRDPFFGWALMVVRGLCFFNPAVQLLARAAVHELEYRAD